MRENPLTRLQRMARLRLQRADRRQAVMATGSLMTALIVVFGVVYLVRQSLDAAALARVEKAAQALQHAQQLHESHRTGAIVFVQDYDGCHELHFDNFTGAFISYADVDCDKRLRQMAIADQKTVGINTANMRGMLDSFKK